MRILLALLLWLTASLAQAGVKIEHWMTPTGARVYFIESRLLPIIDIQVDFAAGAAYDPPGKSGLAGLTRSLLDTGADELDEENIAGRLVDIGARLSGSTDLDRASLSLRTLASVRERDAAIDLMRTVLQQPRFPAEVLEREKARTVASIKEEETRPGSIAAKRFSAALYPEHPYGLNATADSVKRLTREDLVAFHRERYGARRATVTIIGDLSCVEAEGLAARLTEGLPDSPPDGGLPSVKPPEPRVVRIAHPATQAHIQLGLPGVRWGDPDYIPLLVGNYILGGGGFVSRLTKEVREKRGYAYDVHSYFQPLKQPGPFQVGLQTKRDQADEALKVVQSTLWEFIAGGPTAEELRAAKRNLADGFPLRIDSNRKILDYLSVSGFYELPLTYLDDFPRQVRAVTAAEIRAAFARHVKPESFITVIVGAE